MQRTSVPDRRAGIPARSVRPMSEASPIGGAALTCVVMPTYNERENLGMTLRDVFDHNSGVEVLVVDDASPDGTGELAEALAHADWRIHVLHREDKLGLGPAYVAGFRWALEAGYAVVCEMDMDGSHRGCDLAAMLRRLRDDDAPDLVIGSRRVAGGSTQGWSRWRNMVSTGGSWYARAMLGLPVRDMTAGFRAYRAQMLRRIDLGDIRANGYVFQIDMTRRVARAGGVIVEVPIVFPDRVRGTSKMTMGIVAEAMLAVSGWGLDRLLHR